MVCQLLSTVKLYEVLLLEIEFNSQNHCDCGLLHRYDISIIYSIVSHTVHPHPYPYPYPHPHPHPHPYPYPHPHPHRHPCTKES